MGIENSISPSGRGWTGAGFNGRHGDDDRTAPGLVDASRNFVGWHRTLGRFDERLELRNHLARAAHAVERRQRTDLDCGADLADASRAADNVESEQENEDSGDSPPNKRRGAGHLQRDDGEEERDEAQDAVPNFAVHRFPQRDGLNILEIKAPVTLREAA